VRDVLTDFESYSKWLPQLTRSKIVAEKGTTTDVEFTLSFRFAVFSKSLDYGLRYKAKGDDRIEWERLSGDFTENRGSWSWVPIGKKRTAVFYEFYVDLASGLGSMVRMAMKASPQMEVAIATSTAVLIARAVKARVESV
jgi:ribosome-associated toxin RatA of RatAB toxin-antitoxin module